MDMETEMETEMMLPLAPYDPRFFCGCVQKPLHLLYCDFVKYYFVFLFPSQSL